MSKGHEIVEGVFYITNVCNLTCNQCMTYNDKIFKGHFNWADYEQDYFEWSSVVSMSRITILGGEPFANPDLINWVTGIRKFWKECSDINVCTNGTYLKNNSELVKRIISENVWLDVCVHDPALYDGIQDDLESIFADSNFKKVLTNNHDIGFHNFQVVEYFLGEQLICKLSQQWNFSSNSTKEIKDGVIYMHTNSPEAAHKNCAAKFCHYFVKGKLHKCYLTGVSNELLQQFKIDEASAKLLKEYRAYSPSDDISEIENYIPQCSLCSDKTNSYPIWPLSPTKVKL